MSTLLTLIYPGRFDPITLGHEDIVARAARLCQQLVVAVATRPGDRPFVFDADTRISLCASVLAPYQNVTVTALDGLLVDLARARGATAIVKGVRNAGDYARELGMARANMQLSGDIDTLLLCSAERCACISSSLVRELAGYPGADLSGFVQPVVAQQLRKRS